MHLQDVPEFTDLSAKALQAAEALQGMWADAWGSLNAASDRWNGLVFELQNDLVEGRKDINTVVDEVRGKPSVSVETAPLILGTLYSAVRL